MFPARPRPQPSHQAASLGQSLALGGMRDDGAHQALARLAEAEAPSIAAETRRLRLTTEEVVVIVREVCDAQEERMERSLEEMALDLRRFLEAYERELRQFLEAIEHPRRADREFDAIMRKVHDFTDVHEQRMRHWAGEIVATVHRHFEARVHELRERQDPAAAEP